MTTAFQSNAFQNNAFQIDIAVVSNLGPGGAFPQGRKKKRRGTVIHYSDFETREAYAAALAAAAMPIAIVTEHPPYSQEDAEDDDLILLAAVKRLIH